MIYSKEFDVRTFKFWGGAKERIDLIIDDESKMSELNTLIEECFIDYIPSEVELNDFVWFECDDFFYGGENE